MRSIALYCTLALAFLCFSFTTAALGFAVEGSDPVGPANYSDWPGAERVGDNPCPILQIWVNGGETNYFRGEDVTKSLKEWVRNAIQFIDEMPDTSEAANTSQKQAAEITRFLARRDLKILRKSPSDPQNTLRGHTLGVIIRLQSHIPTSRAIYPQTTENTVFRGKNQCANMR